MFILLLVILPLVSCAPRLNRELTPEQYAETFNDPIFNAQPSEVAESLSSSPGVVENAELPTGPIVETGRFTIESSKLLKGTYLAEPSQEGGYLSQPPPQNSYSVPQRGPQQPSLYRYDGPLDGRHVTIYKKIHTPVHINADGTYTRLPGAQVVEQWAQGGYGNEKAAINAPIYSPNNNGFFTQSVNNF